MGIVQSQSTTSDPHGPRLVFHPEIRPHEIRLAERASGAPFAATILFVSGAAIVLLIGYIVAISSEQPWMCALLAFMCIGYAVWIYHAAIKPYMLRRKLLQMRSALWLWPGQTRFFYELQTARINNYVDPHHRHTLRRNLHVAVRQMLDKELIANGDDSLLLGDRTELTTAEAQAEYNRLCDEVKAKIDMHVLNEPTG